MKFTVSCTEFQRVLGTINGVIPAKSALPILETFLFEVAGDTLRITATDLEISMTVELPVSNAQKGVIAVPAKKLFETVRALPALDITLVAEPEHHRVTMSTGTGEYKLTGESSENYPSVPAFKGDVEFKIDNEMLRRLINKTVFAVSTDELRPAMMGILLQMKKNEMRAVATDGHRLVRLTDKKFPEGKVDRDIIIPAKALNLLVRSANESDTTVAFNDNNIMFTFGGSVLISRLIEEKYPNYESVIPLDNDKRLMVDKNQLLQSVRRTALYASTATHQVRFSLKKGEVTVSAEDIDFGSEARETIQCEYNAEPMEIGFNSQYIVDILTHLDTDEVVFQLSSPTRACVVYPGTQREEEDLLMLVMPVRLNA